MSSRAFRALLLGLLPALAAPVNGMQEPIPASNALRPNVVILVLDATRIDHLSCYGYASKTSPALERIAARSTVYEECIAAAPWTLPSVASLFTGRFPRNHGVNGQNLNLDEGFRTLAEFLRDAGYRTAGFSANPWVGSFSGLDQGFERFTDIWRELGESPVDAGAAAANSQALEWLDSLPRPQPFLLFLHYMEPHFPYRPPQPYDRRFSEGIGEPDLEKVRTWETPREIGYILKDPGSLIAPREMAALRAQYDGEIGYLDTRIGELFDALERRRLLDRTLLVITADHGEHLGDHDLLDHKFSVYESLIRVPLIVYYPDGTGADSRVSRPVQNVDILPTILDLCGIPEIPDDGVPLPRSDSGGDADRTTFSEFSRPLLFTDVIEEHFPMADYAFLDRALLAVRQGHQKLIWASDGRHESFNLSMDPGETRNLIDQLPEVAARLIEKARQFREMEDNR